MTRPGQAACGESASRAPPPSRPGCGTGRRAWAAGSPCARRTSASGRRSPGRLLGHRAHRRPRAAGARRRAGRPGGDPLGEPAGVALHRRGDHRGTGDDRRVCTRRTRRRGGLPAVPLRARRCSSPRTRSRWTRRSRCSTAARTWSASSTSSRAASATATTTRSCWPGRTCWRSASEHRAAHPGAVEAADGRRHRPTTSPR